MTQSGRLHSFDNLRAIMMWLGIVLHTAINHTTGPSPLPWRDSQTSPVADLVLVFIHAFRMPVFFIIAGYFVALLVARRGFKGMLAHRMRRLALPFALFWPVLIVCTTLLMAVYLHLMAYGTAGIDLFLLKGTGARPASPFNTMHMWFIYYLIWFCVLTAVAGSAAQRATVKVQQAADRAFRALGSRWWGLVVLTLPLAITGSFYRAGMLSPNGSFIPNLNELVHNGVFFVFGLFMYRHQDDLFPRFAKLCWRNTALGFVVFVFALGALRSFVETPGRIPHVEAVVAFLYGLTSWLWSLALIGIFLRYVPHQNRALRYVSDSSYWVFLVHMLGTIGFGAVLYSQPFGAVTKMGLNILATTAGCLLTYQLFVRYTVIGVLLNGRRQPKAAAPVLAVEQP